MNDDLFERIAKSASSMSRKELDAAWLEIGRVKHLIRNSTGISKRESFSRLRRANDSLDAVLDEMYLRDHAYIRRNHPNFSFVRFYLKTVDAVYAPL